MNNRLIGQIKSPKKVWGGVSSRLTAMTPPKAPSFGAGWQGLIKNPGLKRL